MLFESFFLQKKLVFYDIGHGFRSDKRRYLLKVFLKICAKYFINPFI